MLRTWPVCVMYDLQRVSRHALQAPQGASPRQGLSLRQGGGRAAPSAQARVMPSTAASTASSRVMGSGYTTGGNSALLSFLAAGWAFALLLMVLPAGGASGAAPTLLSASSGAAPTPMTEGNVPSSRHLLVHHVHAELSVPIPLRLCLLCAGMAASGSLLLLSSVGLGSGCCCSDSSS